MAEGEFYAGGVQRFQREGGSRQEKTVKFPDKDFDRKHQELIANGSAEEIARKYKLGRDLAELLRNRTIEEFTPEFCEEFVRNNPDFNGYHPALILAVAEAIVADQEAQDVIEKNKH